MNELDELNAFEAFLSGIDLGAHYKKYAHIKLVELDMPREIQPLRHLYREYWKPGRLAGLPDFESFYAIYREELKTPLAAFQTKAQFSEETFWRGLPARMYRTWASILTQIQGGYAIRTVLPGTAVEMSAELDWKGIDIRVSPGGSEPINIQIKKETYSREVRAPHKISKYRQTVILLPYKLTPRQLHLHSGEKSKPYKDWENQWGGKLKRLDNGFVVFRPQMFALEELQSAVKEQRAPYRPG